MVLYFFTFQTEDGLDYEAVENAEQARKYEAAGWERVGHAAYIAAWKERDTRDFARMWTEAMLVVTAPINRPIKDWMPAGYMRFHV